MSRATVKTLVIATTAAFVVALSMLTTVAAVTDGWNAVNVIGTWVGGVGTTGALAASIWLLAREAKRDRDRDGEREQQQAERVAAWYGSERRAPGPGGQDTAGGSRAYRVWRAWVRNDSTLPVFNVQIRVYRRDDADRIRPLEVHLAESSDGGLFGALMGRVRQPISVLAPQQTIEFSVLNDQVVTDEEGERSKGWTTDEVDPFVDLVFQDSGSRWWERNAGDLRRIAAAPAPRVS
ncbi:hypothetical protein [Phytohabitans rumicis]|nr:hypothetical protein [Phytohabitans rumicis]